MKRVGTKNITEYLFEFAGTLPDKPILLHPEKISYKAFCDLVDSYALGFLETGILQGTKTIVLINPGIDLFATIFALLRIGAIPVLIDPGMGVKSMTQALSEVNAEALVGVPKAWLSKYVFPHRLKSVRTWILTRFFLIKKGQKLSSFRKNRNGEYEVAKMGKGDEVAIFFTSGSTGPAKAVVYKHHMFEAQIAYLENHFQYHPQEIDLCTFPLIGLFSMCLGLSVVLADMDMTHPAKLNPKNLIENIQQFACTYLFCSPMVLQKMAQFGIHENLKLHTLKRIMTAGAPVAPELLQNFAKLISNEAEIHTPYGATEALPVTDIQHKELLELYRNTERYKNGICIGYPLRNMELRIIQISDKAIIKWEDVNECGREEVGEIVIRGENVTQNYLNNKRADEISKIKESNHSMLWHRTGDLGRIDDKGRVWFYGRKLQRVVIDDGTLFTIPTEAVFNRHEAVERSALVSVQIQNKTKPVICIQLKSGQQKTNQLIVELQELAQISNFTKGISAFLFVKKFPVDPRHNAKIYREKLALWAQKKIK